MDAAKNEETPNLEINLVDIDNSSKEEAIRVCTRMRPLFENEINRGHIKAWKMQDTEMILIVEPPSLAEMLNARDPRKGNKKEDKKKFVEKTEGQKAVIQRHYVFDKCFDDNVGNADVYKILARDIVLDTFKGINGCILAYGQTGSGKTHSVMGVPVDPGMLPRSLAEFFEVIENPSILKENNAAADNLESDNDSKEFLMRVTYLEVYMERVNDLLQEGPRGGAVENLDVKEDPKRGFVVIGIHEETVTSIDEVMLLVAKAEQRRHIAQTNFNETSSRSHTIFTVLLESNQIAEDGTSVNKRGELKIVDLAGNERAGRAAEGVENAKTVLEEGKAINKSLFVLSEVISKLSKRAQALASGDEKKLKKIQEDLVFIPWRDSKLTRILSKSLGGNCRASVIVAVHPSHLYLDTSFSTLRFALKCKTIKKKIEVNYLSPEQSVIMQQKELIAKLQNQLKHLVTSKNIDIDFALSDNKYVSAKRADDDEKILALKQELEDKVKKFQNFILKSELQAKNHTNYIALRSIDMNNEKDLKYSMTVSANMQNEFNWLRSFGTHEYDTKWDGIEKYDEQNEEEKLNITKAMDYLKNKVPYRQLSSGESEPSTENFEKIDESISVNYFNELEQLEKLEKDVFNKMHKKDKIGGSGKILHKEYEELSNVSDSKEETIVGENTGEVDTKKKDKSIKKKNKVAITIPGKDLSDSIKVVSKKKLKMQPGKIVKGNKVKKRKSHADISDIHQKIEGKEQGQRAFSNLSKEESVIGRKKKEQGSTSKGEIEKDKISSDLQVDKEEHIAEETTTIQNKESETNEVHRTSIITNLKQKIAEDLKKKKKIYERNVELNRQIKFVMKLMQKVGLSAMLTGAVPAGRNVENVLRLRENLKDKLKLTGSKRDPKALADINAKGKQNADSTKEDEKLFESYLDYTADDGNTKKSVTSLSHAFVNEMFYSFLVKLHQKDAQVESPVKDIDTEGTSQKDQISVSNQSLEEILGTQIMNEVQKIENAENKENFNAKFSKGRKNSKQAIASNTTGSKQKNSVSPSVTLMEKENATDTIQSILNLLTPWEQKILALLYEQQKLRKDVQELKKNFAERIKNINFFIKKILIDKVEVEEHFKRVLETIEKYKSDLLQSSDIDSNFKFANLMKKLEDLSIALAEKNRDFNVLAEFHLNLRKTLQEKENLIAELQEENKLFYLVPKYHELLKQLEKQEEGNSEAVRELKKEFLLMYGRLMMAKKQLDEKEVVEKDMRQLNTNIYSELVESITVIKNLESQYKFLEFKMNKDKTKKEEKIRNLIVEKMKLNKVVNEMERMLQEANINADGLKDDIIANYELSEIHTDFKEEEEDDEEDEKSEHKEEPDKFKDKQTTDDLKKKKESGTTFSKKKKKKKMSSKSKSNNTTTITSMGSGKRFSKKDLLRTGSVKPSKLNMDKLESINKTPAKLNKIASDSIKLPKQKQLIDNSIFKKKDTRKKLGNFVLDTDADDKTFENKSDIKNVIKRKKLKKKKNYASDTEIDEIKLLKKSSSFNKKKKKKKEKRKSKSAGKLTKRKENSDTYLQAEVDEKNEALETDNSETDHEANEMREILNMEIEKKKKKSLLS